MRYYIRSGNGVTEGWYLSRKAAENAARRSNEIAPEQGWHVIPVVLEEKELTPTREGADHEM